MKFILLTSEGGPPKGEQVVVNFENVIYLKPFANTNDTKGRWKGTWISFVGGSCIAVEEGFDDIINKMNELTTKRGHQISKIILSNDTPEGK